MASIDEQSLRAIEFLLYEWARTIDEGRLESLAELLIERGEYKVVSRFNVDRGLPVALIHTKSRAQLRDRITSMRVANVYEPHNYRHAVSGVQVIGASNGVYEVRANYTVIRIMDHDGSMALFACGQYQDKVVFEGGTALFQQHQVTYDSRAIDTLLVLPL
ncbi:MAG: anthranilate 1,2-dioxygenase [Betaproteobacteria bacterium]|nr:anthranilate 1,2-dioxygenase [Betaproteobacteria bacterium]